MIRIKNVHKRYHTDHGPSPWVLTGITMDIPQNVNVGLIGGNGAGKSTLLRLIAGVDQPTKGSVERNCRVSWPMGLGTGFQGHLTGRQNAKFVCRVLGHDEHMADRIAFVESFADIGKAFDEQVRNYSSGMRSRLNFALSLAFEFDVYISDETTGAGDAVFRQKAAAAFRNMVNRAGLIMVSHSENTLRQFCQAGVFLYRGQAHWFDNIDDAIQAYKSSIRKSMQLAGADQDVEMELELEDADAPPKRRQKTGPGAGRRKGIGRKGLKPKRNADALDTVAGANENRVGALGRQRRAALQSTAQGPAGQESAQKKADKE